ncbi:hypothetical protein E5720_20600 [Rhodococcus sp. PAMC28707]|uniref:hypothetical protein n=1 Tax=unclassified Rhodococcus (in: high G+C Gram-positive bacteria) TaxID=192944 RepID=UPI00109D940F|nr:MULTISPECIES: hypothetical protein [unclassified Rhodococcus (in: high G+C Gram-positive bacteria)]QCB51317.1 hypothetical protein E5769_14925 [Rhodococcus sp. PAMC28705]QCB60515.1 hypothetical protein E5720_20600 [Rhodococcus sp. PAMC28707]
MYKFLTIAAAAVLSFGLVSCAQNDGKPTSDPGTGVNAPSQDGTSAPATTAESTNSVFGQAFTFKNGLSVGVSGPQPFSPSASASTRNAQGEFVSFDVTIVNGSADNYEPAMFSTSLQSGNTEADQVFDTASGIGGAPSTVLLPSRESQFTIAFEVSDPADLVLQVSPGFEYRKAIFTN